MKIDETSGRLYAALSSDGEILVVSEDRGEAEAVAKREVSTVVEFVPASELAVYKRALENLAGIILKREGTVADDWTPCLPIVQEAVESVLADARKEDG